MITIVYMDARQMRTVPADARGVRSMREWVRERRIILPVGKPGERKTKEASDQNIMPMMAIVHGARYCYKGYIARNQRLGKEGEKNLTGSHQRDNRYPSLSCMSPLVKQMEFPRQIEG